MEDSYRFVEDEAMAMGRRRPKQQSMWLAASEVTRGPRNVFYERLNEELARVGFDRRVEEWCAPYYEEPGRPGRPSVPPGVYFRMLFVGYFEGIESERGIAWRCADSLSLKHFLGYEPHERTPDHSTLSKTRKRLGPEVFEQVFKLVLRLVEQSGLLSGKTLGVDSTLLRADASMKAILRKGTGETYPEYLRKLAAEEGMEEPTAEDLRRMDRKRKGKKASNQEWESKTDPDARIARLKDGRTRLAYKAEHVVDLETGALVNLDLYPADRGDTSTILDSLDAARENLQEARAEADDRTAPGDEEDDDGKGRDDDAEAGGGGVSSEDVIEVVADKGYHKASLLRALKDAGYRTYIPERKQKGKRHWKHRPDGAAEKAAFHGNRRRVRRAKGRLLQRKRGELVERTHAHLYETGALRRVRLRGHDNVRKRLLLQAAAANLGLVMRKLTGSGTPRGFAERLRALVQAFYALLLGLLDLALPNTRSNPHHQPPFSPSRPIFPATAYPTPQGPFLTGTV